MKFSINKNTLLQTLLEHNKVVPLRTSLPVLSCAFFEIGDEKITIKTTDLEQTIISSCETKTEGSTTVALPLSKLLEIVSVLPDEEIFFEISDQFLVEINSRQGVYKISGRKGEDFPTTPEIKNTEEIKLNTKDLFSIIEKTGYAASKDDLKPALCGVYLNFMLDKIIAVATDGHKLAKTVLNNKNQTKKEKALVVPLKFLNIIKDQTKNNEEVSVEITANHIQTKQGKTTTISRIINEQFPDFNSVIPEDNNIQAKVNTKKMIECLKRVSIFSNKTTKQTILSFSTKGILFSAEDIETATSAKEHLDCVFKGEEITTSYNAKYLTELLQHLNSKETTIYLKSALTAALFKPTKEEAEEETTALLMPIRLNKNV